MKKPIAAVLLLIVFIAGSFAQVADQGQAAAPPQSEGLSSDTAPAETPQWARNLRRAEIVATGSFPLTLLASRLVYSLLRFVIRSIEAGGIDLNYAPWFLAPPGAPELEFGEKLGIVAGATGLSTLIAIIDYRRGVAEAAAEP